MNVEHPSGHDRIFNAFRLSRIATAMHLDYLKGLAQSVEDVVELGVNRGASSAALAYCKGKLISYDIDFTKYARKLKRCLGRKWEMRERNTLHVRPDEAPPCDLLFMDSLHTYEQLVGELKIFAPQARKYIVFHDTITFATDGANGETGNPTPQKSRILFDPKTHGIRLAIDEFMIANPEWKLVRHAPYGHGLLTLEKK